MTDTEPPTTLDDVIVTGQRARGPSPFADLQWPTKGNSVGDGEMEEAPDGPGGGGALSDETIQCGDPAGRKQWNADAKAVGAPAKFAQAASERHGEPDWENREMGALMCEFADGSIDLGPIISGEPIINPDGSAILYYDADGNVRNPGVPIPPDGCGSGRPIGFVHTHFAGNGDFAYLAYLKEYYNAPADAGMWVVARMNDPATSQSATKITHSKSTDQDNANAGGDPNWVDPNAAPCPGSL